MQAQRTIKASFTNDVNSAIDDFKVMFRDGKRLNRARGEGFDPLPFPESKSEEADYEWRKQI